MLEAKATLDSPREESTVVDSPDQLHWTPGTSDYIGLGRHYREKSRERPQLSSKIRGRKPTSAHVDSAEGVVLPEFDGHEPVHSLIFKLDGKVLCGSNLIC